MNLIARLEYGMERWNGKWNGTCTQLYASVRHVVVQGCASYYVSVVLISPQRLYEQVQCCQHSDIMVKTRGPCDSLATRD